MNPDVTLPTPALDVPVPRALPEAMGYPGIARYVGFTWDSRHARLTYDDGRRSGQANEHVFFAYRQHWAVCPVLSGYGIGSSEVETADYLVFDSVEGVACVATAETARAFLETQHPSPCGGHVIVIEDSGPSEAESRAMYRALCLLLRSLNSWAAK